MSKPVNITYDELVKTITRFWIDNALEESINAEVENFVTELETKLTKIGTKEGLRDYIRADKASLGNILGLMEISEEKFKEISEAHEVLSDKQKRARYDQFGHAGVGGAGGTGHGQHHGLACGCDSTDLLRLVAW